MEIDSGALSPDGRWQVARASLRSRSAVMAQLCEVVVAVDAAGDWEVDGCSTLPEWVAQAGSSTEAVARQVVVTARRLAELPALWAALAEGRLSWEQVVPAARFATPDTDARLAEELVGVSPAVIEVMARSQRPVRPAPDRSGPWLRTRRDPDGVNRLLCDAELTWVCHDGHGAGVGIARVGRETPAWLARRILDRDLCCRFPGCERRIRQIHHLRWWTQGGETTSDNLIGLCWTHHRAVHEGEWSCVGDGDGDVTFTSPKTKRRSTSTARPERTPPRTTPAIRRRARVHLAPPAIPARARARTSAA